MTQPPPKRPTDDKKFARDVAKQIDRRRVRRRLTLWSALLGLVAAAAFYLRCGAGLGLGGIGGMGGMGTEGGDGGSDRAHHPVASPVRCAIRIAPEGIVVNSHPRSREEAVAACKTAGEVDIYPTGDTRHGDVEDLRSALVTAGAKDVRVREPGASQGAAPRN